jgi:hypothetical protein
MVPFVLITKPCIWQTFRKYLMCEDGALSGHLHFMRTRKVLGPNCLGPACVLCCYLPVQERGCAARHGATHL